MAAQLEWHDEDQSIICCTFTGEFGIDNYAVMEGQLPMMVREGAARVDVILHLARGASLPPLRGILQEVRIIGNVMPENFGVFVGVGAGLLLSNPVSVWIGSRFVARYFKNDRVFVASSLPDAEKLIMELRG